MNPRDTDNCTPAAPPAAGPVVGIAPTPEQPVTADPSDTTTTPSAADFDRERTVLEGLVVDAGGDALLPFSATRAFADPRSAPLIAVPDADDEIWERLGVHGLHAIALANRSLAENTVRNYTAAWLGFVTWCEARNVCALPAHPIVVAAYLVSLTLAYDEDGQVLVQDDRIVAGRLRPQSADIHLTAINHFHASAGAPKPGDAPYVQNVCRGIRRTFGVARTKRKSALHRDRVEAIIRVIRTMDPATSRDPALAVLLARGAGDGVLARLTVDRVSVSRREAIVRLPSPTRSTRGEREVVIAATQGAHCPVAALAAQLRALADDTGVVHGHRLFFGGMTKQGIAKAETRLAGMLGRADLQGLTQEESDHLRDLLSSASTLQVRDEALISTGFITAMRRSNLSYLNWTHCIFEDDRIVLDMLWSKTNQEGAATEDERYVDVPIAADRTELLNPGRAFLAWRDLVAARVGGDPSVLIPDQPVFVPVDRHGNLGRSPSGRLQRLSGDAINEIVKGYCEAIGLDRRQFGAHSLRIGLVTTMVQMGFPIPEIMQITKHRSQQMVLQYVRAHERKVNSPARRLLSRRVEAAQAGSTLR